VVQHTGFCLNDTASADIHVQGWPLIAGRFPLPRTQNNDGRIHQREACPAAISSALGGPRANPLCAVFRPIGCTQLLSARGLRQGFVMSGVVPKDRDAGTLAARVRYFQPAFLATKNGTMAPCSVPFSC